MSDEFINDKLDILIQDKHKRKASRLVINVIQTYLFNLKHKLKAKTQYWTYSIKL